MEKLFENKVALITGGSYGIGRAIAIAFAKQRAKIAIADWKEDKSHETLKQVDKTGSEGIFIQCDVSRNGEVNKMIDRIIAQYGQLDFAVNNAGIEGIMASVHECSEENWDKTISVNLTGVWLCMKHEISQMLKQGKGVIINTSSVAGLMGFANLPAYVASKHAVVGLTKSAALENAKTGIRVNAVCPGVIRTEMIDRVTGKDKAIEKQYEAMEPIGRMGKPEEVAEAAIWLCSDAASFVTGVAFPVDGGWLAG
jgi:NAD(P)-dependent dehydrogenase (short-subunit alcohol dehydrogenase family)